MIITAGEEPGEQWAYPVRLLPNASAAESAVRAYRLEFVGYLCRWAQAHGLISPPMAVDLLARYEGK